MLFSLLSGIVTAGSDEYYMESYILLYSKDRKNWKLYKDAASKERKVGVLLNAFTAPTSQLADAISFWSLWLLGVSGLH